MRCVRESLQTSNSLQLEFSEKNDFEEFLNTIKRWEVHDLNENEEKSDSGEDEKFVEVDEHHQISETLPKHVKITVDLSNHCLHFLASKDRNKKIIVLEILNDSVLILSKWENELLPLVHKIWSPLVTRFDQMAEPLIIRTSFTLLCTLAQTSKQFIRSRTLK